jgi:hypothetical protein
MCPVYNLLTVMSRNKTKDEDEKFALQTNRKTNRASLNRNGCSVASDVISRRNEIHFRHKT